MICCDPRIVCGMPHVKFETSNPALVLAEHLMQRGVDFDEIDWALVAAHADICEKPVVPEARNRTYASTELEIQ